MSYTRYYTTWHDYPNTTTPVVSGFLQALEDFLMTRVTTSVFAGGPPGSPSDGDIWIGTSVDASGTRWQFQYNASSASAYKWESIGGLPAIKSGATGTPNSSSTWTAFDTTNGRVTVSRAGDYIVIPGWWGANAGAASGLWQAGVMKNGAIFSGSAEASVPATTGFATNLAGQPIRVADVAANDTLDIAFWATQSFTIGLWSLSVAPIRIA